MMAYTIDKQYQEYLHQCEETGTTPMPFTDWLMQLDEAKEMKS